MNVGYGTIYQDDKNMVCPICGNNVYVSKSQNDYACVDINCPLGHGARNLMSKVYKVIEEVMEVD